IGQTLFILGITLSCIICLASLICMISGLFLLSLKAVVCFLTAFLVAFPVFDILIKKIRGPLGKILFSRVLRNSIAIVLFFVGGFTLAQYADSEPDIPTPYEPAITATSHSITSPENTVVTATQETTSTTSCNHSFTPSPVQTVTSTPSPTQIPTPTPQPTATPSPTPKPTATLTPKPTATPTLKPSATPASKPTTTPSPEPLYSIPGMDTYTITENIDKRFGIKHPRPGESVNGYIFTNSNSEFHYDIYTYESLNDVYMAYFYVYNYSGNTKSLYNTAEKYLVFLASIPYDTYDPDVAQQWVRDNIKNVSQGNPVETIIGDARFCITGDPSMGMISLSISVHPFPY
ncbi:MAG: hypothetical protein IJC24_03325, partial [Clostridia bacterium]|nr:hypothetical protein [Clostridia bacterium]